MSLARPHDVLDTYLDLELAHPDRHELVAGEIVAMGGASMAHNQIAMNLALLLGPPLRARGCSLFAADLRVLVEATETFTYPDLVAFCQPARLSGHRPDTLLNPELLVEILSPSTEARDRGAKAADYRRIPSLTAYLLVAQNHRHLELFERRRGEWRLREARDDEALELPLAGGLHLELDEVYAGVAFDGESESDGVALDEAGRVSSDG